MNPNVGFVPIANVVTNAALLDAWCPGGIDSSNREKDYSVGN